MINEILIGIILFLVVFNTFIFVYMDNRDVFCIRNIPAQYVVSNKPIENTITTKCICGMFADCPIKTK